MDEMVEEEENFQETDKKGMYNTPKKVTEHLPPQTSI